MPRSPARPVRGHPRKPPNLTDPHSPKPPSDTPPQRYAVLHHTGHGEPHFDLLIGRFDAPLITLRLPTWPVRGRLSLTRLPDHRPIYLDYEGPVSGNRGEVKRVEAGTCDATGDWLRAQPTQLRLHVSEIDGKPAHSERFQSLTLSMADGWIEPAASD